MASAGLRRAVVLLVAGVLLLTGCESAPNERVITKGSYVNVKVSCV